MQSIAYLFLIFDPKCPWVLRKQAFKLRSFHAAGGRFEAVEIAAMEDKKKDVTIYDLAQELNVSPSTVSRALNDHASIGKNTKKLVKSLAKKRGYRPNAFASSLRTNRTNTFGVMVSWINRPFISSLISGIEKAARHAGYHVIITQSHDYTEMEKENLQALHDSRISALIVSLAMETEDLGHFDIFNDNEIPIVFVDRIPHLRDINKVNINNFSAAFDATEHLIAQGCRRIAHFGGARHQEIYEERRMGYLAALKKGNFEIDESLILHSASLSGEEGTRLTEYVLSLPYPPDGIFCANDTAAVYAIQCAKRHGVKIPQDLAIIGFNNDPICEIIEPTLSSVHHPAEEMGIAAVQQALGMLSEDGIKVNAHASLTLETHIVVRGSSDRRHVTSQKSRATAGNGNT